MILTVFKIGEGLQNVNVISTFKKKKLKVGFVVYDNEENGRNLLIQSKRLRLIIKMQCSFLPLEDNNKMNVRRKNK